MTTPIHFKGADYASVEAMPPDIRAAYEKIQHGLEQMRRGMAQAQRGLEGAAHANPAADSRAPDNLAPAAPAWGGPRPEGSLPVPVEFDAVTDLGPALAVHEHDGLRIFPNFGAPRPNALVRYRDGLAYHGGGKEVHSMRWEEMAVIVSNLWRHASEHGLGYTEHEYTLTKTSGDKLVLDDGLKGVEELAEQIKLAVFARLAPPLAARYQSGEALTFGPVTIQRQNGLQLDGKLYGWDAIQDLKVESGRFQLTLRTGKKHEARVSAIPNLELLCQLIGLKFYSPNLPYS